MIKEDQETCHWPGTAKAWVTLNGLTCIFFVRADILDELQGSGSHWKLRNTNLSTVPKTSVSIHILLTCSWTLHLRLNTDKNNVFWWMAVECMNLVSTTAADPRDGSCFAPSFEVNTKEKALRSLCEDTTFLCSFWTEWCRTLRQILSWHELA